MDEYRALCRSELALLGERQAERFAFLGSGALPLTAILLAQDSPGVCVTCVDSDGEACELAARLVALLGLKGRVTVTEGDARDHRPADGETVICASLLHAPGLYARLGASARRTPASFATRKASTAFAIAPRRSRMAAMSSAPDRRSARGASIPAAISRPWTLSHLEPSAHPRHLIS